MIIRKITIGWALLFILAGGGIAPALAVELPQAKPDKGLVIFYRMNLFTGKAIRFNINHTTGTLGQLLAGTMLYKYVPPGEQKFVVQSPSVDGQDSITINVEAGKIYYVKGEVLMGWPAGRPKFSQVQESQAKTDLAKLK
jgi:hypothetical protein